MFEFLFKKSQNASKDIISQCHEEVHKIHEAFAAHAKYSDLDWFFDSLDKRIDNSKEQILENFKLEKGLTADDFVLYQISETSFNLLMTGRYCSYRGVLNMEGQDLRRLHTYANNEMKRRGYLDPEVADDNIQYLDEELKNLG